MKPTRRQPANAAAPACDTDTAARPADLGPALQVKTTQAAGRVAEARPADRLAAVVPLPGALLEPVTQQRRRGRNPREVAPLWRKRMERAPEFLALRLAAQLEHAIATRSECYERCNDAAADVKALENALKEATARELAFVDEYGRHENEVKRLKADLAEALRWVGNA